MKKSFLSLPITFSVLVNVIPYQIFIQNTQITVFKKISTKFGALPLLQECPSNKRNYATGREKYCNKGRNNVTMRNDITEGEIKKERKGNKERESMQQREKNIATMRNCATKRERAKREKMQQRERNNITNRNKLLKNKEKRCHEERQKTQQCENQ